MNYKQAINYAKHYKVSGHFPIKADTLVGCVTNDGEAGFDVNLLKTGERFADISGIGGDCQPHNFPITGLAQDEHGFTVAMISTVGISWKGSTILSSGHVEANKTKLNYGGSIHVIGKQRVKKMDKLPHVVPSSDQDWDPDTLSIYHGHPFYLA